MGESRARSFADRAGVDAVLALGLIHHLAISNNVPLGQIASFLATLGKWLIVEWVPKDDSQFQRLLNSRDDVFPEYAQPQFEEQFRRYFEIERAVPLLETKRTLYLMRSIA